MARANTSLPVPVSPLISTVASVGATVSICRRTALEHGAVADDLFEVVLGANLVFEVRVFLRQLLLRFLNFRERPAHSRRRSRPGLRPGSSKSTSSAVKLVFVRRFTFSVPMARSRRNERQNAAARSLRARRFSRRGIKPVKDSRRQAARLSGGECLSGRRILPGDFGVLPAPCSCLQESPGRRRAAGLSWRRRLPGRCSRMFSRRRSPVEMAAKSSFLLHLGDDGRH